MAVQTDLRRYQRQLEFQLQSLAPIFAKAAIGDFSSNVKIPRHENELTEFFVGVQIILDAIREKIAQLETTVQDLRAANRLLANEKARVEAILNSLGDGLVTVDAAGHVTFVNQPAIEIIGPQAAILGQDASKLLVFKHESGLAYKKTEDPLLNVLASGKQLSVRLGRGPAYYLVGASGAQMRIAFTITPIRLRSRTLGAVLIFRDITEESNTDRTKSEIISIASHQLRTPLTTIRWYVNELIKNRKLQPSKRSAYLAQVRDSNRRMIDLVEHLLNVSRIELGTLTLKPELTDITKLISAILADLKAKIDDKKLHILTEVPTSSVLAFADRSALQIVLQNIISNAVEFSYERGTVVITLSHQKDHIMIRVADQGCGIPVGQQSHIFTKLFRAANAYQLSTTGSGLGLYISRALIEQMKGKVWFTSHENKGTTMYVTIPTKHKRKE